MPVRYVQLDTVSDLFSPVTRAFGNIAIIGATTAASPKPFDIFTDPDTAKTEFPGDLGTAIALAFQQTPGPTIIYGIPAPTTGTDFSNVFATASTLDVQLVVLANTPLTATTVSAGNPGGIHTQLANHVATISKEDGKERIGVAMFNITPDTMISQFNPNIIKSDRMVYIAHKTKRDVAVAVAGTIAGYEPSVSLLLKPVILNFTKDDPFIPFTPSEIDVINGPSENNSGSSPTGVTGQGVNWLTSPSLLPGGGIYMGEGYTGDASQGVKFIDVRRTIDDLSFRLKARLIRSVGSLRIGRSDLRALIAQMEAVLDPFVRSDILSSYEVSIPLLTLLDKDPNALTPGEHLQIVDAEAKRLVQVLVTVEYQAAIHRLAIALKFQ